MDFLELKTSRDGFKYLLILKDHFSKFARFIASKEATSDVAAAALYDWYCDFSMWKHLVSDNGSHFYNHLIAKFNGLLNGNSTHSPCDLNPGAPHSTPPLYCKFSWSCRTSQRYCHESPQMSPQ